MYTLGTTSTGGGGVAAVLLPKTGGYRPLFIAAVTVFAFGLIVLIVSGITAFKQSRSKA